MIEMRLLEDNDDGTNDSGYYGMDSRMRRTEWTHRFVGILKPQGFPANKSPQLDK